MKGNPTCSLLYETPWARMWFTDKQDRICLGCLFERACAFAPRPLALHTPITHALLPFLLLQGALAAAFAAGQAIGVGPMYPNTNWGNMVGM